MNNSSGIQMPPKEGTRNISLDMLRILSMFMIVVGHCLLHGGIMERLSGSISANYILTKILYSFLLVHVNCFVLVSGYFLCSSKFRLQKWLKIWGISLFYSVTIYLVLCYTGNEVFSALGLIKSLLPFTQQRYWFVTTYLLMYILCPLCNAAIERISQREHLISIISIFTVYIFMQNIFIWKNFTNMNGNSPFFFLFLYLVASYMRKYPFKYKHCWLLGYIICASFAATWIIIEPIISVLLLGYEIGDSAFSGYNSIPYVLGSVCFFMTFLQINIRGQVVNKLILLISPLTFGIYLIHDHPEMRTFMWDVLIRPDKFADSPFLIAIIIIISGFVYFACAALEKIREYMFCKLKINNLFQRMENAVLVIIDRHIPR